MMSMNSFGAYGKVNETEQARLDYRRKSRKRIFTIVFSFSLLVGIVLAAVLGTLSKNGSRNNGESGQYFSSSVKVLCNHTLYPDTCFNTISPLLNSGNLTPDEIGKIVIEAATIELSKVANAIFGHAIFNATDQATISALQNCEEVFTLALNHLNDSLSSTQLTVPAAIDDLLTWLSAAGTFQQTCIDTLAEISPALTDKVVWYLKNTTEATSNSLAIVNWLAQFTAALNVRRRLLSFGVHSAEPDWLRSFHSRRLLQSDLKPLAKYVVANDGSGNFTTIMGALEALPEYSSKTIFVYVKQGVYDERVRVETAKTNVFMFGDGMNLTIVTGSRNNADNVSTFDSSSFAAFGAGFVARDMAFVNTAGAAKFQAVALMSTADKSIFYRCRIDAFQDTLYTHSNRQFYRECTISGTVDFIFGNSAVVFQNCTIIANSPLPGQSNTITAQGKIDPNQNTGISIQDSVILPSANLSTITQTYLGRPWKNYSTTVYLNNYLDGFINPSGWLPWMNQVPPKTIFYAEFNNSGPGSNQSQRVKWPGVRNISSAIAAKFTVSSFIKGSSWIPEIVPYKLGL